MALILPPPPHDKLEENHNWREWFFSVWVYATQVTTNTFNGLAFVGSNITSIVTRNHNDLTIIQGGSTTERYHLTAAQQATIAGLGTMSTQNSNAVAITGGTLILTNYTVATLPTGSLGQRAFVTDALTPAFGVAVVGGGAVGIPVYKDGTSWKVG